jgi:hypothetical protein
MTIAASPVLCAQFGGVPFEESGAQMSYDLFFRSPVPGQSLSHDEFVRYFDGRPRYEMQESQAWYSNEDTGVYFAFEHGDQADDSDSEGESEGELSPVAFNLNYFRPHAFGLEAEPEVAAFVDAFDLTVHDPQMSGMGDAEYSRDGFLRGWNAGNEFAHRALLAQNPTHPYLTLPASQIETYWRWNFERDERQEQVGEAGFVPRIFFFDFDGEVKTGAAWGDGIAILLPTVDLVLVPRKLLAPRGLFRAREDIVVFTWSELEPILEHFPRVPGELVAYELFYDAAPVEIERLIRDRPRTTEKLKGVAFDQVLDQELIERAKAHLPTNGDT